MRDVHIAETRAGLDPDFLPNVIRTWQAYDDIGSKADRDPLADEVMFLHRGRLLEMSPAERFFTEPANDLAQMFVRGELLWWRRRKERDPRHDP